MIVIVPEYGIGEIGVNVTRRLVEANGAIENPAVGAPNTLLLLDTVEAFSVALPVLVMVMNDRRLLPTETLPKDNNVGETLMAGADVGRKTPRIKNEA